jgi:hypothetical protein
VTHRPSRNTAAKRAYILKVVARTVRGLTRDDLYAARDGDIGAPEGDLDRAILSLLDDGAICSVGGRLQRGAA